MPRQGPGQPPFELTPEQRWLVQVLAANSNSQALIARNVGRHSIDKKALRKHFAKELANGRDQVVASIGVAVIKPALAGEHARGQVLAQHAWRLGLAHHRTPRDRWLSRLRKNPRTIAVC